MEIARQANTSAVIGRDACRIEAVMKRYVHLQEVYSDAKILVKIEQTNLIPKLNTRKK